LPEAQFLLQHVLMHALCSEVAHSWQSWLRACYADNMVFFLATFQPDVPSRKAGFGKWQR
jgi:hypothetical protein